MYHPLFFYLHPTLLNSDIAVRVWHLTLSCMVGKQVAPPPLLTTLGKQAEATVSHLADQKHPAGNKPYDTDFPNTKYYCQEPVQLPFNCCSVCATK